MYIYFKPKKEDSMKKFIIILAGICFLFSGALAAAGAAEVVVGAVTPLTGKLVVY